MAQEAHQYGEYCQRDRTIHPPALAPTYKTSVLRSPRNSLISLQNSLSEITAPVFSHDELGPLDHDLILNYAHGGLPVGERIVVHGFVWDEFRKPVRNALVEVWQANAGGRYRHRNDTYIAPVDPNFGGCGRVLTDSDGHYVYRTIKPGPYPWRNHRNAWRPAHIHFSLFGSEFTQRMVTQMYFPGDPLFPLDPIYQSVVDPAARARLVAAYDHDVTTPEWATGYRWDIVLTGPHRTLMADAHGGTDR
jgi:protocatechuate 3,4-dioxygenase beta subunit